MKHSTPSQTEIKYEGRIKNITTGKWYGGTSKAGNPIHSKNEKDAVLFWDEAEAEAELAMLNDTQQDCYTLFDNVTPPTNPTASSTETGDSLFNQIANISKAGAYDILVEQVKELKEENESLRVIAKSTLSLFNNEANYPEGTVGYNLAQAIKRVLKINQ